MNDEERLAAIARGDIIEGDEEEEIEEEPEEEEIDDEEADTEEEETGDDDDNEEDEPGAPPPKDSLTIPKARYDEDRQKSRREKLALEARIAELEGKVAPKNEVTLEEMEAEIEDLEDQHENLLLEGEIDKAKAIRRQMNIKRNAVLDRRISEKSKAMGAAAVQQVRYDTQLAAFEAKYPTMNEDSPEFDEAVSAEVGTLMNAFVASGMNLVAALNKAVHYVFRDSSAATEEASTADEVRAARKIKAREKALAAVKKTPTNLSKVGRNSDKAGRDDGLPDPLKMSQAQFDKLTEKQLAAMREDKLTVQ